MNKVVVAGNETDLKRGVDYIGVTAGFVVHDGEGNILMQKRSKNCRDEKGTWDFGGGAVEFGEKLEDAVRREVGEELLAKVLDIEFWKSVELMRDNNGTPTHWIAFMHAVLVDPKEVKIGEPFKVDEIGWFNSKNMPSPLHSIVPHVYDEAIRRGIIS